MANAAHFSAENSPESDAERSSSLSDLDDGLDADNIAGNGRKKKKKMMVMVVITADADSEAETERLEISPNKRTKEEEVLVNFTPLDPSLPESSDVKSAMHQMEAERFSDSAISSPGSSDEDLMSDGGSDSGTGVRASAFNGSGTSQVSTGQKRKRVIAENDSDGEEEQESGSRRKRTGSIRSDAEPDPGIMDDDASSDGELSQADSQDPIDVNEDPDDEAIMDANDDDIVVDTNQADTLMAAGKMAKATGSKTRSALHEEAEEAAGDPEDEDLVEGAEDSDEEDIVEPDEAEDAEAVARSEEERRGSLSPRQVQPLTHE